MNTSFLPVLPFAALALTAPAAAQCIDPPGTSQMQNGVLVDGWTASIPIGFAFQFGANTYTHMYISDHGLVALQNGGVPAAPPINAFVYDPTIANLANGGMPLLAPYWSDHSMFYASAGTTNEGELWVDNTSGTSCTVSWTDVETYIDGSPFSFQMVLRDDGTIDYSYDTRVCNDGSTWATLASLTAIVGLSENGVATPAPSDLTAGPAVATNAINEVFTTSAPLTCNPMFDLANKRLQLLPTNPGWVVVASSLDCALADNYGAGCDGLSIASTLPELGSSWDITINGLQPISPIGLFFFGGVRVDPGLPLTAIGFPAPGCNVHVGAVITNSSAPAVGGAATLNVPIPSTVSLTGATLTVQGLGLTLNNVALLATSGGLEGTIGN
jgi:hypothetical protein